MTHAQLDAAYDNSAAVGHSAEKLADWIARSERARARRNELLDISYGPPPRNKIDIFRCGRPDAPLLAYIHGGIGNGTRRSATSPWRMDLWRAVSTWR